MDEADSDGVGVGLQAFGFGHCDDGFGESAQTVWGEFLEGHLAVETVEVDPAEGSGPAAGRQGVVGAGSVVARALRGPGADEDAACRRDAVGDAPGVAGGEDEVLGGVGVGEGDELLLVVEDDAAAVAEGLLGEFGTGQESGLALHFGLDGPGALLAVADQDDLAVRPVFGLREQVGRSEGGWGLGIGDDHHLGGAGGHVDGDGPGGKQLLGGGDVLVARAEDLVHLGDALRAVCHRGDGLGAAQLEDALHPAIGGCVEHFRVDLAIPAGGGAEHHFAAAGDPGGDGEHQHGGEQGRGAAGNVEADLPDRDGTLPAAHAGGGLHADLPRALGFVEGADVALGVGDGLPDLAADARLRFPDLVPAHLDGFERAAVNLQRELAQRRVALLANAPEDLLYAFPDDRVLRRRPAAERGPLLPGRIVKTFHIRG